MLSNRKTWGVYLALSIAAALAAPVVAAPVPDAGKARVPVTRLMPADTEAVVVVNWRQILESPMVKKQGLGEMKTALAKNDQVQKVLTAAGLDPFRDIDNVMVAFSDTGGGDGKMLAVVRGNFDLAKVQKVAADHAEKKPGELKITEEGRVRLYEVKGQGKSVYAAFADRNTLVATPSKDYTLESIKNLGKKPAPVNKEMQAALDKADTKDAVWFAVVITAQMKKGLASTPQTKDVAAKLESVTGGIRLTDNLRATVLVNTTDADAAAAIRKKIMDVKPFLAVLASSNEEAGPVINEFLSHLKIDAEKSSAKITLEVTESMMEKAAELGKKNK